MTVSPIGPGPGAGIPSLDAIGASSGAAKAGAGFERAIADLLGDANSQQMQADGSLQQLITGETENVHDVVLSMAKADLSFRMVLEIRNRLTEAYQEVMRMQF